MSVAYGKFIKIMGRVALFWCCIQVASAEFPSLTVNETNRFAWSETTGWIEVRTNDPQPLRIEFNGSNAFLAGFAHSDALGPIAFSYTNAGPYANNSATNWGVNLTPSWDLAGFAWSPAAGWIRFDAASDAFIHQQQGHMQGYAWSDQIGLIRWGAAATQALPYGITVDIERNAQDLPLWWIDLYGETNEVGEVTNAEVFFAGTTVPPRIHGAVIPGAFIFDTVSRRYYTIEASTNLLDPSAWTPVQQVPGSGQEEAFQPGMGSSHQFYRFTVGLDPANGEAP